MYKEASASYSEQSDGASYSKTTELSFAQGYKFHYEGNGISEQDQIEIDEALKKFKPEIEKFMAKSSGDESAKNASKPEDWLAALGANMMPPMQNDDMKNMTKSKMTDLFDELMKKFNSNTIQAPKNSGTKEGEKAQSEQEVADAKTQSSPLQKIFDDSKRLLDKIFSLMDGKMQIQYA
jgi:hypothetical protein